MDDADDDRAEEERREAARRELAEMASRQSRSAGIGKYAGIGAAVGVLVVALLVGNYARSTIVDARYQDGVTEFCSSYKKLDKYEGTSHFSGSQQLFQMVTEKQKNYPDAYVFQAAIKVIVYNAECKKSKSATASPALLTEAEGYARKALEYRPNDPGAYYYLAAVEYYRGDRNNCKADLDKCAAMAETAYAGEPDKKNQWLDKVKQARRAADDPGSTEIDLMPIRQMIPMIELVK